MSSSGRWKKNAHPLAKMAIVRILKARNHYGRIKAIEAYVAAGQNYSTVHWGVANNIP